jgi:c-di-GMP-binding flagellar brake protein YcgR
MPELMRAIANHLRDWVGNRRRAPRYKTHVLCSISLLGVKASTANASRKSSLEGHTCDISATGVGLIVPAIRINERYLYAEGTTLVVGLHLPDAKIEVHAVAARYERLDEDAKEKGYLVGAVFTEMSDAARGILNAYLKTLAK